MNKKEIERYVEEYINKQPLVNYHIELSQKGSYINYLKNVALRLLDTYSLYCSDNKFYSDLLLSLRIYLLTFDTSLSISSFKIIEGNDFAVKVNTDTQKVFASFMTPNYLVSTFVKDVYLAKQNRYDTKGKYNLYTDSLIYRNTGFKEFKTLAQKLAVYSSLNTPEGYTTLVSLPTGGGKSLISQTIAYQKRGLTIIIVPTVSLAMDQERVAKSVICNENVEEEIFSYSSGKNIVPIINAINDQSARMLFISPEALINNPLFISTINKANEKRYLKNIVIDEAHIVLDWGASLGGLSMPRSLEKKTIINQSIYTDNSTLCDLRRKKCYFTSVILFC